MGNWTTSRVYCCSVVCTWLGAAAFLRGGGVSTGALPDALPEPLQALLKTIPDAGDGEMLFQPRKGRQALCVTYLNSLVRAWCRKVNPKGNFGNPKRRKTFGYIHRTVFNTDIPKPMQMFNHASRQPLTYLGIQPSEIKEAYLRGI
jgi:hypothetical protein